MLIGTVAVALAVSFLPRATAQKRVFSHFTRAHNEGKYANCNACHSMPTKNWMSPRRDKLESFPDVATFPSHISCNVCHSKGAKPDMYTDRVGFCGSCHFGVPTPRAPSVLTFPIRSHSTQFTTTFPHDVHQDIIASNEKKLDVGIAHLVFASFSPADNKPPQFNNCAICHMTEATLPRFGDRDPKTVAKTGPPAGPDTFKPKVEFFKDMPRGHESCFTCHFQGIKAPASDCASCHKLAEKPYKASTIVERYSLKFNHNRVGHVEKDCTICHVRITQSADVRLMKDADVPISSCKECHAKQEDTPFRKILTTEIESRETSIANKQPIFQCIYCHTSAIGRYEIPVSHRKQ